MTEAHRKRNIRAYQKKVAERRCVTCGKQDGRTLEGKRYCRVCYDRHRANASPRKPRTPEQREYENANKREWTARLKALQVCTLCGTKDRRTVNGRGLCERCAAKRRKWQGEHRHLEADRAYAKARRDKWREQGLCTYCGGKREEPERMLCIDCRVKARMKKWRKAIPVP